MSVYRLSPTHQTCRVRHLPPSPAVYPSLHERPHGRHALRPNPDSIPHCVLATFFGLYGSVVVYIAIKVMYHFSALMDCILLRQVDWTFPPFFDLSWMSNVYHGVLKLPLGPVLPTHICRIWCVVRRYTVGEAQCGFAMSGFLHDLGICGLRHGIEFRITGEIFLICVRAASQCGFRRLPRLLARYGLWFTRTHPPSPRMIPPTPYDTLRLPTPGHGRRL